MQLLNREPFYFDSGNKNERLQYILIKLLASGQRAVTASFGSAPENSGAYLNSSEGKSTI